MITPQEFKPLLDFIIVLTTVYLFALFGVFFLAMGVYMISVKIEKDEVYSLSHTVPKKNTKVVGIPTWSRVNGRLVKKLVVNDIEDECDGGEGDVVIEYEDLDSVKKDLLAKFDACHILFKNKMWYRKNDRLVRIDNLY